jgi:hypothetical protein
MKRLSLVVFGLAAACGGSSTKANPPMGETADATAEAAADPYAAECANAATPPNAIECTGLYTDVVAKTIAPGVRPYGPAVPLWSDGAVKQRWIYLPPGTQIDASDPNEWVFPVGTKAWKQFVRDGKRVETRLWQKVQAGYWVRTTYAWNADETSATVSSGGDIPWSADGGVYHIPTQDECDQCHRGRNDHLLGFEQVSLGLAGATGLTLEELVQQQLITPPPSSTSLKIGDDGTGVGAAAMGWLHINCGASCHNANSNSTAYGSGLRMRLDPTMLDGRSSANFDARATTINQLATTPTWNGQTRIVPGDPMHSLLVKLITNRGTNNPVANQMPPIATNIVDVPDTQTVIEWIGSMPPNVDAGPDAETADATAAPDGSPDAGAANDATGSSDAQQDSAAPDDAPSDAAIDGE